MPDSHSPSLRRLCWVLLAVIAVTAGLTGAVSATSARDVGRLAIETASNPRPELVSGGDVLVRVARLGIGPFPVRVLRDGNDVTSAFTIQPDGTLLGLVTGLRAGGNTLVAESGARRVTLHVTNHDRSGPILSGPQQEPFYCETTAFGLAPAQPPRCEAPTRVTYRYRTTGGVFGSLADPDNPPADAATVTVRGRTIPYVVRLETGTINRAVYQTAVLYSGDDPSPTSAEAGWNGKLVYTFGGGCNGGHRQGATTAGVLDDLFLSRGFGVASSTLNVLDNNCGPVLSAETAMMVKERFAEVNGPITHTIGWGGSGGAIQQYEIADAYPGILDGIVPAASYPDPLTAINQVADCGLLNAFFAGDGASFTQQERQAVAGYVTYGTCTSWDTALLNRITPTGSCPSVIPVSARWNATTNPDGVRCAAAEQWANQLGRDPGTGFVRSVRDNTGVQYGLAALESGRISAAQFVRLNAGIGGYDVLGARVPWRTSADPLALSAAYSSGLLNTAGLGLAGTPIIDQRFYQDRDGAIEDIHTAEMSFVMRERLARANGSAANQVIIMSSSDPAQVAAASAYQLDAMDRWLTAIRRDTSDTDLATKVIAAKPADLGDGCYLESGERIREELTYQGVGRCADLYPVAANPRLVAGADLAMTTLKCRLRPIDFDDYPVSFTAEQQALLTTVFPDGVCDHDLPGVAEQEGSTATWRRY